MSNITEGWQKSGGWEAQGGPSHPPDFDRGVALQRKFAKFGYLVDKVDIGRYRICEKLSE